MLFAEGSAVNRPPMFNGMNYAFWKVRMRIFMESIDALIWEAVVNGPYVPMQVVKDEEVVKPRSEWNETERRKAQHDLVAKNIITSALTMDEFFRISQCKSAKEMWEVLEVTHEGTEDVKRSRKHALIQEYELFRMQPEESIADVQKRFTHIVNHLTGLGKEFDREELNTKILKCLDRSWQPKVTAISESRDLSKLGTAALFGKLMEHELELKRLKEQETTERKPKGLALKATELDEIKEEKEDAEDDDTISLLTKRFSKFLRKKSKNRNQQKRRYPKPNDSNSSKYTCFGCGKTGHIKTDCPDNQTRDKSASKKFERNKGRRAYISWEENEVSSTSSSSTEDEENNLCFMMKDEESSSESVSNFSADSDNYDDLLAAFKETHDEANRLAVICNKLQKVNNVLAPKVKTLEEELHKAKTDLVSLELTCLHASIKTCENCKKLEKQVEYLLKTLSNFTKGRENLESLLGSQNVVFNKNGLGYTPGNATNVKKLSSFFVPAKSVFSAFNSGKKASHVTCFYCMKSGHTSRSCIARKHLVPKNLAKWLPKRRF